ncbi:hypothetical protein Pvag_pPag20088 (plasmid) [Pantoea vagans C9-1]|nr:hypothetical protein Pvag_pPag20088 [Pantoea vagans C9-1]
MWALALLPESGCMMTGHRAACQFAGRQSAEVTEHRRRF